MQQAAHRGAKKSKNSGDGDTIAILPGFEPNPAIGHADIIIPTGLDVLRNGIVANSDAVICIQGGSGTSKPELLAASVYTLVKRRHGPCIGRRATTPSCPHTSLAA